MGCLLLSKRVVSGKGEGGGERKGRGERGRGEHSPLNPPLEPHVYLFPKSTSFGLFLTLARNTTCSDFYKG